LTELLRAMGVRTTKAPPVLDPIPPKPHRRITRRGLLVGTGAIVVGGVAASIGIALLEGRLTASLATTPVPDGNQQPLPTPGPIEFPATPFRFVSTIGPITIGTSAATSPTESSASSSLELAPGVSMEFVLVPAGNFLMGSDKTKDSLALNDELPQHVVTLSAYYIGKYEVTVAQFAAFANATGYKTTAEREGKADVWNGKVFLTPPGADWQHPLGPNSDVSHKQNHPVTCISWDDADAFTEWLSKKSGLVVQLPTEAQWEKAARGTKGLIYPWGDKFDQTKANTFEGDKRDTTPVDDHPQGNSPFGVANMIGNVWEWCQDWFDENTYNIRAGSEVKNPTGPTSGSWRVARGGSWRDNQDVRVATRSATVSSSRSNLNGFRVVRLF